MKYFLALLSFVFLMAGTLLLAIALPEHPVLVGGLLCLFTSQYIYDMLQHFRDG